MSTTQRIATLTRFTGLTLLLTLVSTPGQAAGADYFLKLDGIDGEAAVVMFDVSGPGEAPRLAMLLPAVQKVRDAASRSVLAELACAGTHIPKAQLTCRKQGKEGGPHGSAALPYWDWLLDLSDVTVESSGFRGGVRVAAGDVNGDGFPLVQELVLTFESAEWTFSDTNETLSMDCSSGQCACTR